MDLVRSRCRGWAYEMALSVREAFAISGVPTDEDLQRILCCLQVDTAERELPRELAELLTNDVLILRPHLPHDCRRWAIAHAIGHLLAHAGSQIQLPDVLTCRQERQADVFAGFLLIGLPCLEDSNSIFEVAEAACVPPERVAQWIGWLVA